MTNNINKYQEKIEKEKLINRLWQQDSSLADLWNDKVALDYLGWLQPPNETVLTSFENAAKSFITADIRHVILVGMGGSVLGALALCTLSEQYWQTNHTRPILIVLDTLDSEVIHATLAKCSAKTTRLILASKSGKTIEMDALYRLFEKWLQSEITNPSEAMAAITDFATPLMQTATEKNFAHIIAGNADIGGRFSIFSAFGLFPAACVGMNIYAIIDDVKKSANACKRNFSNNPGAQLGAWLATLPEKNTPILELYTKVNNKEHEKNRGVGAVEFSAWLSQLIAESTGKGKHGLLPLINTGDYWHSPSSVTINVSANADDICSNKEVVANNWPTDCFRFEFAMAIYGLLRGFNPFNQPHVESTKTILHSMLASKEQANRKNMDNGCIETRHKLAAELSTIASPDFIAVLDFIRPTTRKEIDMLAILATWQTRFNCPVVNLVGPAYLHSVGQLFKGGDMAKTGYFIVLIDNKENASPLSIPGLPYTFDRLRQLQALSDAKALRAKNRKVLLVSSSALISG